MATTCTAGFLGPEPLPLAGAGAADVVVPELGVGVGVAAEAVPLLAVGLLVVGVGREGDECCSDALAAF